MIAALRDFTDRVFGRGSAAITFADGVTQPKIPPCAAIMRRPISWNSGKYEPTQSETTTQS